MKKINILLVSTLSAITCSAYADNGYFSNPTSPSSQNATGTNGYSSSVQDNNLSFSVNIPTNHSANKPQIAVRRVPHRYNGPHWVNTTKNNLIPPAAVIAGREHGDMLYLCRGAYHGGIHPGKIIDQFCHISWGGEEIALARYQVLVSKIPLTWIEEKHGVVPHGAISGGFEGKHQLYICQAAFNGGIHPGKVVGQACNIAWGGKEVAIPVYGVLVG